jgi:hypothetical protein
VTPMAIRSTPIHKVVLSVHGDDIMMMTMMLMVMVMDE